MKFFPVIGLAGKARVGKDTTADMIISARGGYKYALADPIYRMLQAGFGADFQDPYWQARKEDVIPALGASPRKLLQTLGTEWGRDLIGQDIWITLAKQQLLNRGAGMVISDIRLENEAEWVRSIGGVIFHVSRSGIEDARAHKTEAGIALSEKDMFLSNNGSLEDLHDRVYELFNG